jgi:hypothetical protein
MTATPCCNAVAMLDEADQMVYRLYAGQLTWTYGARGRTTDSDGAITDFAKGIATCAH